MVRYSRRLATVALACGCSPKIEPAAGRVAYVVTDPDVLVTEIKISIVPAGDHASRATVTYRRSALTERSDEQFHALTADWAAEQAHHWGTAIAAALKRSVGRE